MRWGEESICCCSEEVDCLREGFVSVGGDVDSQER